MKRLMPMLPGLILAAAIALPSAAHAQMWRLEPDLTFEYTGMGWTPLDAVIAAVDHIGVRQGGYVRAGYGVAIDMDYYFLIPERESAFWAYAGMDMLGGAATGFTPGGAAEVDGPHRQYTRAYLNLGLEQVLFGDRRHMRRYLMLSVGDVSRYVMPAAAATESAAPAAFFTHAPYARLSFELGSRRPFWNVMSLAGGAGATLEAGHSGTIDPWAFVMADADLGFRLAIAGHWLYLEGTASLDALAANLTPGVAIPAWSYLGYADKASAAAGLDLKSRVLQFDPILPMGLDLGVGAGTRIEAAELAQLDPLSAIPILRAFTELALGIDGFLTLRVRVGATWDPSSGEVGFLFETRN